jgi:orotidine-5'-phosphate decarboxylase
VGLTSFVEGEHIKNIQNVVGDKAVLLLQGIGPQGGEADKIKYARNPLVSLGRAVIYADAPREAANRYQSIFKAKR